MGEVLSDSKQAAVLKTEQGGQAATFFFRCSRVILSLPLHLHTPKYRANCRFLHHSVTKDSRNTVSLGPQGKGREVKG